MSELNQNEIEITGFKIKLTNLKKKNFPDELIETDYLKYKVGDILRKGAGGTVYKVVSLYRSTIRQGLYDHYLMNGIKLTKNDPKFKEMMDRIKESSNFGVCYMKIVPIMKNYQPIVAKRMSIISELDQICCGSRQKYWRYDLISAESSLNHRVRRNKSKIQAIEDTIRVDQNRIAAVQNVYIQHCVPPASTPEPYIEVAAVKEIDIVNENPF